VRLALKEDLSIDPLRAMTTAAARRSGIVAACCADIVRRLLALATLAAFCTAAGAALPNIALFYGKDVPWDELSAFDVAVVEPDHVTLPLKPTGLPAKGNGWLGTRTELLAYLSVGEIHPSRPYFRNFPTTWRAGENTAWGSVVVDQSRVEWAEWFMANAVRPLWKAGYRGFFLDTLDSFQLVAKDDAARQRQTDGLIRVVRSIKAEFPDAKLIFNRGFEILPEVHGLAFAVAAESLFQGWDAGAQRYKEVNEGDRNWLLGQLNRVKTEYLLPVLAIDYVAPGNRALARQTARRIADLGFVPWISNPALDMVGVGTIEVMPRKVLVLYDGGSSDTAMTFEAAHRYVATPLNYLGYTTEYREIGKPLPAEWLAGRYAGIVALFSSDEARPTLAPFLRSAIGQGVRIAFLGAFGLQRGSALKDVLGLPSREPSSVAPTGRVTIARQDAMMGFEAKPLPDRRGFFPLEAARGQPLLTLRNERGETMDAAALMPWGGYALRPYSLVSLPSNRGERWVIQPIEFLRKALALPDMPVPDPTTESGRRLMLVHIDGDGFANRAELPGTPYAGEVLQKEILEKYRVPTTVSVIEGEVSSTGLYASQSPALEAIARRIFALPQVEIASHSYSHPFRWSKLETASGSDSAETYNLPIPNYRFSVAREVGGSLKYINEKLAPPGKSAKVFLWTGDCNPDDESIGATYHAGVANMNGGETWISRAEPSLTLVAPIGIRKGDYFQVYAPNQNENVYTNLWTGPFYGYERVIETFELTDKPYRLKPINIYYHTYSASKRASLTALHKVYQWSQSQSVINVFASDYTQKALDFVHLTVARSLADDSWRVRGAGQLRTLRMPASSGHPDLSRSSGVVGYNEHNGERYLSMDSDQTSVVMTDKAPARTYLVDANARVVSATSSATRLTMDLAGHMPITLTLANAGRCDVRADGKPLAGRVASTTATHSTYEMKQDGTAKITVDCGR
jgi:uncharacterized protein (TIGR01370 family)